VPPCRKPSRRSSICPPPLAPDPLRD
jgi:hypothetical protein